MGKSKDKDIKTNAMRFLDSKKIKYTVNTYECEDFVDGVHIAKMLGQDENMSYKTLVTKGKSGGYFVFVLPVALYRQAKRSRLADDIAVDIMLTIAAIDVAVAAALAFLVAPMPAVP